MATEGAHAPHNITACGSKLAAAERGAFTATISCDILTGTPVPLLVRPVTLAFRTIGPTATPVLSPVRFVRVNMQAVGT